MKQLFLDESGDHSLDVIDPQYPVFVLGGVILDQDYTNSVVEPSLQAFKRDVFGSDNLVLHTADLMRAVNGFERMDDPGFRCEAITRLNELIRGIDFKVVACAIKKYEHRERYVRPEDPYMYSLEVLTERFCLEIGDCYQGGTIYAEKRGGRLDTALRNTWNHLRESGCGYMSIADLNHRIRSLNLRHKKENLAGLQLADLIVSPIGRHVIGKRDYEDWEIIKSKFRKRPETGDYMGRGLVILPKK